MPARAGEPTGSLGHIRLPVRAKIPIVPCIAQASSVFIKGEDSIQPVTLSCSDMAVFPNDWRERPLVADSEALRAPKMDREGVPISVDEVVGQAKLLFSPSDEATVDL